MCQHWAYQILELKDELELEDAQLTLASTLLGPTGGAQGQEVAPYDYGKLISLSNLLKAMLQKH